MGSCSCACSRNGDGDLTGLCGLHSDYLRQETNRTKKEVRKEAVQDVTRTYEEALEAIGSLSPMKRRMVKLYVEDQIDEDDA